MGQPEAIRTERRGRILSRLPFRSPEPATESLEALIRVVRAHNPKADLREIQRAYAFAEESHRGQKRLSGDDFIVHPLSVAMILPR